MNTQTPSFLSDHCREKKYFKDDVEDPNDDLDSSHQTHSNKEA
jgi:hypothetical protein